MTATSELQWNLGGWLGGQIGETCWMLIAGLLALPRDPQVGTTVLVLFAIPNIVGWRLWAARDRLSPIVALRSMAVIAGLFGIAAVFVLERDGLWEAIQTGGTVSANGAYALILGVVGVLLLLFGRRR